MMSPYKTIFMSGFAFIIFILQGLFPTITYPAQGVYPTVEDFPLPKQMNLCGEPIPLEDRYTREMLDRELTISVWDRAQVFLWLKRAGRYFPYLEERLGQMGMPDDLKYLSVAESSLLRNIRSHKGARGLWQFMSRTARIKGLRKDRTMDERRHFERSTDAALKYLKELKGIVGTWHLAMAAYNCGEDRLKRKIREQQVKEYYRLNLPLETERYIFRIAAIKLIMGDPERYGYRLPEERVYKPIKCDSISVRIRVPIPITKLARSLNTDFKVIKELNPHILGHHMPLGRYSIKIPPGTAHKAASLLKRVKGVASRQGGGIGEGVYVVQSGDTLGEIAKKVGISVSRLKTFNGLEGSLIIVGQKLRLAP